MIRWIARIAGIFVLLILAAFWIAFFSARPPLTMEPAVLAGDGAALDYCALPELDSSGKRTADIPKGNTPGCGYEWFPMPVLAECTEPLVEGAQDIRGLWQAVDGKVGHVERVEQCGDRTVITTAGIIHDMGTNATGGITSNDTEGGVLFMLGGKEYCPRTSAGATWRDGKLEFKVFGWGPVVVRRYLDGDQLVWEYADGSTTRMNRICTLPEEHKVPEKRGKRIELF